MPTVKMCLVPSVEQKSKSEREFREVFCSRIILKKREKSVDVNKFCAKQAILFDHVRFLLLNYNFSANGFLINFLT